MRQVDKYYQILELEPGATLEDVNQGYKDMVFVWHPDRFANHPRLQKKAHAKIQQINEARERLQATEKRVQAIASPPPAPAPKPRDFYQPTVTKTWTKQSNRVMSNPIPSNAPPNQYDASGWLD